MGSKEEGWRMIALPALAQEKPKMKINSDKTNRCCGTCCKAFVLGGYTREKVQRCYDNALRLETEGMTDWVRPHVHWYPLIVNGILRWWPWMEYLGHYRSHPITGRTNNEPNGLDYFTCNQLSPEGNCMVYDQRPHFCRSYGVDIQCEHTDCTWKDAWHWGEKKPGTKLEQEMVELKEDADKLKAKFGDVPLLREPTE